VAAVEKPEHRIFHRAEKEVLTRVHKEMEREVEKDLELVDRIQSS
jgi:hypothetical protein